MDKKTKTVLTVLIPVAVLAGIVLTAAGILLFGKNEPPLPAVTDPATVVRSPAITGKETYPQVAQTRKAVKDLIGTVSADGYPIAHDITSDTYYLSISDQSLSAPVGIAFSVTGRNGETDLSMVFEKDIDKYSYFTPENNGDYYLRVYNGTEYQDARIVITTMPFLTIETEDGNAIGSDEKNCILTLRDGNWKEHGGANVTVTNATLRIRGATARSFEKKAYKVNLKQEDYETQNHLSLLGLRNDDDWILDAMYIDPTRMHNKLATEIWNGMSSDNNASDGEYVEVILNGNYVGLYDLIEPIDRKQLDLDEENGLLIKTNSWEGTYFNKYIGQPLSANWMGFEVKHPEEPVSAATWGDFYDLLTATADSEDDPEFFAYMMNYADHENLTDYWLFLTAFSLRDNRGKNLYWSSRNTSDDDAVYIITPWDCDLGFGYRYGRKDTTTLSVPHHRDNYENDYIDDFKLLKDYLICDINSSRQTVRNRWETLSSDGGVLSLKSVLDRMNQYRTYLNETGAWVRETERWPDSMNPDQDEEFQYMEDWLTGRYEWMETRLDEMMNGFETVEEE